MMGMAGRKLFLTHFKKSIMSNEEKIKWLEGKIELSRSGFGGVDKDLKIVDRRMDPSAVPFQRNAMFGIQEPKEVPIPVYDENTVLGYGKHKFKSLKNIPSDYFINIVQNKFHHDKSLLIWITENIEEIEQRIGVKPENTNLYRKISFEEESAIRLIKSL